ncbi:MAG: amidase family protein, partial [Qipengyuania citrea]|uniref:amidase family protein n=1 Tax=Qipengyuania citrea TaxID=225971 RepID=UPI0032988B2B
MFDLPFTFSPLEAAYAGGTAPEDIVEEVFRRIEAIGDPGIFIHLLDKEEVLEQASELGAFDATKPLWGIPFVTKDNIDAGGRPTTAGCPAYT